MSDRSASFRFRPAIWTSFLVELSPEEMARAFSTAGWRELELSTEHGDMLLKRGSPDAAGAQFRAFSAGCGVSFHQGHLWLEADVTDPARPDTVDGMKKWLDLFVAAGVRCAVIHPGGRGLRAQGADPARIHEATVRAFTELCRHVAGGPLVLCIENMTETPVEALLATVRDVGSPHLAICLDTGHLHLVKGDPAAFIRAAGPHLRALHIADNDGSCDQHLAPFGRGAVDWKFVLPALRECGYSDLFNLEIPGERRCPPEVLRLKLDYLKRLLDFMGTMV